MPSGREPDTSDDSDTGLWGYATGRARARASRGAGTYGRSVSKSRSSLFVDRTAAQQLMPSRPGRRHGRSSRGRGLTGRREYVKRSCQRLKSLFCPLLQHDVLEERI